MSTKETEKVVSEKVVTYYRNCKAVAVSDERESSAILFAYEPSYDEPSTEKGRYEKYLEMYLYHKDVEKIRHILASGLCAAEAYRSKEREYVHIEEAEFRHIPEYAYQVILFGSTSEHEQKLFVSLCIALLTTGKQSYMSKLEEGYHGYCSKYADIVKYDGYTYFRVYTKEKSEEGAEVLGYFRISEHVAGYFETSKEQFELVETAKKNRIYIDYTKKFYEFDYRELYTGWNRTNDEIFTAVRILIETEFIKFDTDNDEIIKEAIEIWRRYSVDNSDFDILKDIVSVYMKQNS